MLLKRVFIKLNYKLILIHLLALLLFVYACKAIVYFYCADLIFRLNNLPSNALNHFTKSTLRLFTTQEIFELTWFGWWIELAVLGGLLIAFLLSLFSFVKRKWFWLNSLITLIIAILFIRFKSPYFPFSKLSYFFNSKNSILIILGTIGIVLFVLSFLLFFNKGVLKFIGNNPSSITLESDIN